MIDRYARASSAYRPRVGLPARRGRTAGRGGAGVLLGVKGLLDQSIKELADAGSGLGQTSIGNKKVKAKSLQIFSRQFATMIEAGLNVVSALVILEEQTDDEALGAVILELRKDVEGGLLLSEAMIRHPKVFSRLYVSMVEAGEAAGLLGIVPDRVACQSEKQGAIRRRGKSAMVYPTMVLIFATLVLIGMLMFLVPIFVKIFASLNGQLPTLTAYVVAVSNLLRTKPYLILLIPASLYAFARWKKTENGRKKWDRLKLKLPMRIGDTVLKITMARFSRTLSTLVAAGVAIIKALEIPGQTASNWVIEAALAGVRAQLPDGVPRAPPELRPGRGWTVAGWRTPPTPPATCPGRPTWSIHLLRRWQSHASLALQPTMPSCTTSCFCTTWPVIGLRW